MYLFQVKMQNYPVFVSNERQEIPSNILEDITKSLLAICKFIFLLQVFFDYCTVCVWQGIQMYVMVNSL